MSNNYKKLHVMQLNLCTVPNELLRKKSTDITNVDDSIRSLTTSMFNIMKEKGGIGLAAIQVGIDKNLFIVDLNAYKNIEGITEEFITDDQGNKIDMYQSFVMINPKLYDHSDKTKCIEEGCLSIPDHQVPVIRSTNVKIEYIDIHGKEKILNLHGMLARVALHEYDHLIGKLIIDYLPYAKREGIWAGGQEL